MRGILVIVLILVCCSLSFSQDDRRVSVQFYFRSVSTTSGADDLVGDPEFTWHAFIKKNGVNFEDYPISTGSSGKSKTMNREIEMDDILATDLDTKRISVATRGYESDGGFYGGNDDECNQSTIFKDYFYKDYQPGITHFISQKCGNWYFHFSLRWDIKPTKGKIEIRDDPASMPVTNFCESKPIYVTLPENLYDNQFNSTYQYYWEYHYVGDTYPVYTCHLENIGSGGGVEMMARGMDAEMSMAIIDECEPSGTTLDCDGVSYDPGCQVCVCEITGYNPIWRSLINTEIASPGFSFTAFKNSEYNNVRLRVSIRKKSLPSHSSVPSSAGGSNFFVYDPPPVLNNVPSTADQKIDTKAEINYSSSTIDITHVQCNGGSTGSISIKSVIGGGNYKFYLKNVLSNVVVHEIVPAAPPSAAEPVILGGLKAGEHILIIENRLSPKDGGGTYGMCYEEYPIYIKQPDALSASNSKSIKYPATPFHISCAGGTDGQVTVTPSGGIGPYDFAIAGFDSQTDMPGNAVFSGFGTGAYTVTTTDDLGCSHESTISGLIAPEPISIVDPVPDVTDGVNITCFDGSTTVDVFVNAQAGYSRTITINGVAKTVDANDEAAQFILKAGSYEITSSYLNCSATPKTVVLKQAEKLNITLASAIPPSCVEGKGPAINDGKLFVTGSGGIPVSPTAPYTIALTSDASKNGTDVLVELADLEADSYLLTISDKYCTVPISTAFAVPVQSNPVSLVLNSQQDPTCFEYDDGKIEVTASMGIPNPGTQYDFYINGMESSEHTATIEFNESISAGTYTVRVEDSKECFAETIVGIGQPQAIRIQPTLVQNICKGDDGASVSALVDRGTGPYTAQWVTSALEVIKTEEIPGLTTITNLVEDDYTLRIVDANGCTNKQATWFTTTHSIVDPPELRVSAASLEHITCNGYDNGYVSLAPTGGWSEPYQYSDDNDVFQATNEFMDRKPGLQTFYVKDARGCVRSTELTILQPDLLEASVQKVDSATCFGFNDGAVTLEMKGGTTPYEVQSPISNLWEESLMVTDLPANTYAVHIRDKNECPLVLEAIVKQPDLLEVTPLEINFSTCGDANGNAEVVAIGGTMPYTYSWKDESGKLVSNTHQGVNMMSSVYKVLALDKKGCVAEYDIAISDIGGPQIITYKIDSASCSYSADGKIDITLAEGTLPYTVSWTNSAITEDIQGLPSGNYRVAISDANNCRIFRTYTVPAPTELGVSLVESKDPTCFEYKDAVLEVRATGGNSGYKLNWADGLGTAKRIENLKAGTYRLDVLDKKGCAFSSSYTLIDPPKFTITLDDKTICVGQVHTVSPNILNAQYDWKSTNGFSSTQPTVAITLAGTYQVKIIDEKGCIAEDTFELITSNDLLKAEMLVAREALAGDTVVVIDISWPLPDAITWQFDATTRVLKSSQDYAEVVFDKPGVYELSMKASLGDCRDVDVQIITINESGEKVENVKDSDSFIEQFEVFPNPTDGDFSMHITLGENAPPARLRMINLSGNKVVLTKEIKDREYTLETPAQQIASGIYFILLEVGEEKKMKRIVIK